MAVAAACGASAVEAVAVLRQVRVLLAALAMAAVAAVAALIILEGLEKRAGCASGGSRVFADQPAGYLAFIRAWVSYQLWPILA